MSIKIRKPLLAIGFTIFMVIFRLKADGIIENAFPEHIIGKSGLLSVQTYLTTYITVRIVCAVVTIAAMTAFFKLLGERLFDMSKAERMSAVAVSVFLCVLFFFSDKCNDLDVHSQMRDYSTNGFIKSISMLSDVNRDLQYESYHKDKYSYLTVKNDTYRYRIGRSSSTRNEKVIAGSGGKTIAQIGNKDSGLLVILFSAAEDELTMDTYTYSGFVRAVAGIDDFSEFDLTDEDVERVNKLLGR